MTSLSDIRTGFLEFFRGPRARGRAVLAARAAQRSHAAVHQCGHGAVQERLHRRGEAALHARDHGAEMRARRRQAQRSRQCRLHRAPSHLLRDAGQFLVRRLFQGRRDRVRLGLCHQDHRRCPRTGCWSPSIRRRRGLRRCGRRSPALPDARIIGHAEQSLGDGRHRALRLLLRNLLRPGRRRGGRPARLAR